MDRQLPSPAILSEEHSIGNYTFIPNELALLFKDKRIPLKKQEALLLNVLLTHINTIVTKEALIDVIWGEKNYKTKENSLNNLLNSLRSKLNEDETVTIATIPKTGYKLKQS